MMHIRCFIAGENSHHFQCVKFCCPKIGLYEFFDKFHAFLYNQFFVSIFQPIIARLLEAWYQFSISFSDFKESSCQCLCKIELTIMRKERWFFNRIKFNVLYVFGCKYSSLKFPFKSEWWMKKVGRGFQFNNNQNLFAFLHHPNFALDFARIEKSLG